MTKLFSLLSHNDILVGLATLGGLIGLGVVIWHVGRAVWRFGYAVATEGWPKAQRRWAYRRALLAYRCAEDSAYFMAIIIEDVLLRVLLSMALGTQLALYGLEGKAPAEASAWFVLSGQILATLAFLGLMAIFFSFLSKFQILSRNVRRIIYSRRAHDGQRPAVWRKPKNRNRIVEG